MIQSQAEPMQAFEHPLGISFGKSMGQRGVDCIDRHANSDRFAMSKFEVAHHLQPVSRPVAVV